METTHENLDGETPRPEHTWAEEGLVTTTDVENTEAIETGANGRFGYSHTLADLE